MPCNIRTAAVLALAAALLPASARAQMFQPSLTLGPQISFQAHGAATRPQAGKPASRSTEATRPVPSTETVSTTYRPDLARRRANLAQFVSRTRRVDPAGANDLAALFAQGDVIEEIGKLSVPHGLRITDVADAYATYWINAYQAYRHTNATPDRKVIAAVKAQATRSLGASPAFHGADDALRQEMAEAMWIQAALLDVAVEQSKNDPARLDAISQAAAQGARGMGLDFARMKLTDAGFVPI